MAYYYTHKGRFKRKVTVRYLAIYPDNTGVLLTVDPRRRRNYIISTVHLKSSPDVYLQRPVKNIDYVVRAKGKRQ